MEDLVLKFPITMIFFSIMKYYLSGLTTSKSFLGPVLILEVPLAAETKKKKPTIPDIPKIAARGSKEKENIKIYKIRVNNSFWTVISQLLLSNINHIWSFQNVICKLFSPHWNEKLLNELNKDGFSSLISNFF